VVILSLGMLLLVMPQVARISVAGPEPGGALPFNVSLTQYRILYHEDNVLYAINPDGSGKKRIGEDVIVADEYLLKANKELRSQDVLPNSIVVSEDYR